MADPATEFATRSTLLIGVVATIVGIVGLFVGYGVATAWLIGGVACIVMAMLRPSATRDRITSIVNVTLQDPERAGYGEASNQFWWKATDNVFKFLNWNLVIGVIRYAQQKTGSVALELFHSVLVLLVFFWLNTWFNQRFEVSILGGAKTWHRRTATMLGFVGTVAVLITVNQVTFAFVKAVLEIQLKPLPDLGDI